VAYLDTKEAFEHLKERTLEGIQAHFPLKGRTQTLHLEKLDIPDSLEHDNIQAQHQAKVTGGTWSVPVRATLSLKNNATGDVVDHRTIRIATIPKTTSRYSYIVE